jgi:crotonobetainyl-CoA:carnitine CoA-transferase CaiB-like acyl-CoA transferase
MGPLDGVRVVDFGQWIAGPLAAMLLADQGAEIVRVDPPGGPRWTTPANATFNRGKTSMALDLESAQGRADAWRLLNSADIAIENFRPGVMARLGLGSREAMERNPAMEAGRLPRESPLHAAEPGNVERVAAPPPTATASGRRRRSRRRGPTSRR